VVRLVGRTALADEPLGPVGGVVLSEVEISEAWSVAPFRGREAAVDAAFRKAWGLGFPQPNEALGEGGRRVLWTGRGRALVCGSAVPVAVRKIAAVTFQGDGIAALGVEGGAVEAVLARLVPVDLSAAVFPTGRTARTFVGHMAAQVTRTGQEGFEIMVMRSMGRTLVHEVRRAAEMVAARS